MKCKQCNECAEWFDLYCQICWEEYCAQSWWAMLKNSNLDKVKNLTRGNAE